MFRIFHWRFPLSRKLDVAATAAGDEGIHLSGDSIQEDERLCSTFCSYFLHRVSYPSLN